MQRTRTVDNNTSPSSHRPRHRRRWSRSVAGAGVAAFAVLALTACSGSSDTSDVPVAAAPLELTGGSDALASCLPFSTEILTGFPTVFAGTVTGVDGNAVTLRIDRWYQNLIGTTATDVVVNAPAGMEALIGGTSFEVGDPYLVSAGNDGTVGYCGYTAPATDELRANFDIAFPAS
jgi:hypothetical protein